MPATTPTLPPGHITTTCPRCGALYPEQIAAAADRGRLCQSCATPEQTMELRLPGFYAAAVQKVAHLLAGGGVVQDVNITLASPNGLSVATVTRCGRVTWTFLAGGCPSHGKSGAVDVSA